MTGFVKIPCTACDTYEGVCGACESTGSVIGHWDDIEKGYFTPEDVQHVEVIVGGVREWVSNK